MYIITFTDDKGNISRDNYKIMSCAIGKLLDYIYDSVKNDYKITFTHTSDI